MQFYQAYSYKKVSALLAQISWTNHLLILSKTRDLKEREFYIKLAIKEKLSKRELERQLNSCIYERTILSRTIVSPLVSQSTKEMLVKDTYVLDFLDLPKNYSEKDFRHALIGRIKDFILELGKDFALIGEEYKVEVGKKDYFIDLLFFHRELRCLVAIELKINESQPEHIGKMNFYLEALDKDIRKRHENPSVGIILCKTKDNEVVKYTLSRNISPALVAEYRTKLINKKILQSKLHELFEMERID